MHRTQKGQAALGLPFLLYLFQESLASELSFQHYRDIVSQPLVKLLMLTRVWVG